MRVSIDTKLKTAGKNVKNEKELEFVDGLKVYSTADIDLKKFDLALALYSDLSATHDMEFNKDFKFALDYIDESFYLKVKDKIAKYESTSDVEKFAKINYGRIESAINVFDKIKEKLVDMIQPEQLTKKITAKKINGQTAIAVKVSVSLDNDTLNKLNDKGFRELRNDKEFIKNLSKLLVLSEEETLSHMDKLIDNEIITDAIVVDLYMNLSNTNIIAIDVTVGDYHVEINSLNGFYYIDFKYYQNGFVMLDVNLEYDKYEGILNGLCSIDNIATDLIIEFNYKSIKSENNNSLIGNSLDFKFYDDDSGIPFTTLDCNLNIETNEEINLSDVSKAKNIITLNKSELSTMKYMKDKFLHETSFILRKLLFNKVNDISPEEVNKFIDKYNSFVNKKVEEEIINISGNYIKGMSKEELNTLLTSPDMQSELMDKLDLFLTDKSKKEFLQKLNNLNKMQ